MTNVTKIALSAVAIALLSGCGDTTVNQTPSNVIIDNSVNDSNNAGTITDPTDPGVTGCPAPTKEDILRGDIITDKVLTSDTLWIIDGTVAVKNNAILTIEPCTTIAGLSGTGESASVLIIDRGSKIYAEGTEDEPIIFTSAEVAQNGATPAVGQWGGLTIIGNEGNPLVKPYEADSSFVAGGGQGSPADSYVEGDSSGILTHVKILNSGTATTKPDQEYNGLSMVGVGSGTIIEDITVDLSSDDGVEIWGGRVNLKNVTITNCTDDYYDIDQGYVGTVTNLKITQALGDSAMEMSGNGTIGIFEGLTIVQNKSNKDGVVYFKGSGVGAQINNATITDNVTSDTLAGAIHSDSTTVNIANTSFNNVTLNGTSTEPKFTNALNKAGEPEGSADALEAKFFAGTGNIIVLP